MPTSPSGLHYTVTELRPPWREGGRPVIFHHGIGTNQDIWAEWLPIVAARHPVLRFDMRGYGRSAVPPADFAPSMAGMVDDLLAVMAIAGEGPVHLIGESLGGTVVLAAALAQPGRVASATVTNTAHRGPGIQRVMGWREAFERQGVAKWSAEMMELRFLPGVLSAEQHAWFAAEQGRARAHVTVGYGEMLAAADLSAELPAFKPPLLLLMPDQSPFVPVRMGAEIKELVPHAELRVFPGVRHGLPFSHANACAEQAVAFIERVECGS